MKTAGAHRLRSTPAKTSHHANQGVIVALHIRTGWLALMLAAMSALVLTFVLASTTVAEAQTTTDPRVPGSGCFVEELPDGGAIVHYAPGIGTSVNLSLSGAWIATLDVDGNQFVGPSRQADRYALIRRDGGQRADFRCVGEPEVPQPEPEIVPISEGGCFVDREGDRLNGGTATIRYLAGIGDSLNLRGRSSWITTLDVNSSEYVDDTPRTSYTIVRRDTPGGTPTFLECGEVPEPLPEPDPGIVPVSEGGCFVQRTGDRFNGGTSTISYLPGIGVSLNLRVNGSWLKTLDLDSSEYVDDRLAGSYTIVRRDADGNTTFFECGDSFDNGVDVRCFVTEVDPGRVQITWPGGDDGIIVLRKDGRWLATPEPTQVTYFDTNGSTDSEYIVRFREAEGADFVDIRCIGQGFNA